MQTPLDKDNTNETNAPLQHAVPYREAIGSLMFLATVTRPDLAFAVSVVARSMEQPSENDWRKVKRIFRYIKGTISPDIKYGPKGKPAVLDMYSDSDYASETSSRKSTSGLICKFAGGAITWKSKLQQCVALSTTEAEFVAASEAAREVIWLAQLFDDLTVLKKVPTLHIDNQSAIKLIKNPEFHYKTKHIDIRYCFTREKFREGKLEIDYVCTDVQIADIFTKALLKGRLQELRELLGLCVYGPSA